MLGDVMYFWLGHVCPPPPVTHSFLWCQVCDFNSNCTQGEDESLCGTTTFESDSGGWQDRSSSTYHWSRIKASESQYPQCTAPDTDHTNPGSGEGYYMWAPGNLAGNQAADTEDTLYCCFFRLWHMQYNIVMLKIMSPCRK